MVKGNAVVNNFFHGAQTLAGLVLTVRFRNGVNVLIHTVMKKIFILLFALWCSMAANAQSCLPEGISFSTQGQINTFQANYPGCTEIGGDVVISGYNITNLNGLDVVTSIGGSLNIECNEALASLSGLSGLSSVSGNLYLEGNLLLTNLQGLQHITFIGGDVQVTNNPVLVNLAGLQGLTSLSGKLWIDDNNALANLSGLDNVVSVGGPVKIFSNPALQNLNGLEALTTVGGDLAIGGVDHLGGLGNSALTSLTSLNHVTSIGGILDIGYNPVLQSLDGLGNITGGSILGLSVYNNSMLSDCEIASICEYLANPTGTIYVTGNAPGCSSLEEIQDGCLLISSDAGGKPVQCTVYPNPVSDVIMITTPGKHYALSLIDLMGKERLTRKIDGTATQCDLSFLPAGIYLLRISGPGTYSAQRVIKQ